MTVFRDELDALRRRDPATLDALVNANTRRLYRAARGMGHSPEEADDLVQEVFLTFLTSLDRFEGRSSVATWLFGVLLRKVQERRRDRAKDDRHDSLEDHRWEAEFDRTGRWLTPPLAPDRALGSRELARAIDRCVKQLHPTERDVFVLRQIDVLSAADTATLLELTANHVGVLLHRARLRLRECLGLRGWRPGGAGLNETGS